jgi:hypothetical protein
VAERSKARVWGRSTVEVAGSNHAGFIDVCCEVEVCGSTTECDVCEGV